KTWTQFVALYQQRHTNNLRLIDIETYVDAGVRKWAGIWRSGTDAEYLDAGLSLDQLNAANDVHVSQNARLVDVETYVDVGVRRWAGLWRSGSGASTFSGSLIPGGLEYANGIKHAQGEEIVDLERYEDEYGAPRWAAIWRANSNPSQWDLTMDGEKLTAEVGSKIAKGQRMFALSVYDVDCAATCQNTVVDPSPGGYNYGIAGTAMHCKGFPGLARPRRAVRL